MTITIGQFLKDSLVDRPRDPPLVFPDEPPPQPDPRPPLGTSNGSYRGNERPFKPVQAPKNIQIAGAEDPYYDADGALRLVQIQGDLDPRSVIIQGSIPPTDIIQPAGPPPFHPQVRPPPGSGGSFDGEETPFDAIQTPFDPIVSGINISDPKYNDNGILRNVIPIGEDPRQFRVNTNSRTHDVQILSNENEREAAVTVAGNYLDPNESVRLTRADALVKDILSQIGPRSRDPSDVEASLPVGTGLVDPALEAKYLINLGDKMGKGGLAAFSAEQFALYALGNRVWNPATIVSTPGLMDSDAGRGSFGPTAQEKLAAGLDVHKLISEGAYSETHLSSNLPFAKTYVGGVVLAPGNLGSKFLPGLAGELISIGSPSEIEGEFGDLPSGTPLVAGALATRNRYNENGATAYSSEKTPNEMDLDILGDPSVSILSKKIGLSSLFNLNRRGENIPVLNGNEVSIISKPLAKSMVRISSGEPLRTDNTLGYTFDRGIDNHDAPLDSETYMPLVFTDLRRGSWSGSLAPGLGYRSIYFNPYISSVREEFSPQWDLQSYFGRVDPVANYRSTNRAVSLAFKISAENPQELKTNWQKISWLTSMVYPLYAPNNSNLSSDGSTSYVAGPVIRLRVGNLIDAIAKDGAPRGLSGIITSLSYDYEESVWELEKDSYLPHVISVSLSFTALHDRAMGLLLGKNNTVTFGGISRNDQPADGKSFRFAFGTDITNG